MSATTEAKQLTTLDHLAVPVSNVRDTVDWYTSHFDCTVKYQDETWALLEFANIRVALVLPEQHPPHVAVLGDPAAYGQPKTHRDGTRSVYVKDPSGNNVEILALK
jgi:catechol 2,3-dioxygenase-like lactoylglutathione lyase family enzyme